jgi:outer membrane protein assembly factor BamB
MELPPLELKQQSMLHPARLLLLVLLTVFMVGCTELTSSQNWPGLSVEGETVYLAYGGGVAAFDAVEGRQLWQFPQEANPTLFFYAPPSISDEQIVIGDYGASSGMFSPGVRVSIYALDKEGRELWSDDTFAADRIIASPLQTDDAIYVATNDNYVFAVDPDTRQELWRFETGHSVYGQPLLDGEVLYVVSLDKRVYALNASNGEVIWQTELAGSIMNQPALVGDHLFVSSFDHLLHRLNKSDGAEEWSFETDDWLWAGPNVVDGVVYIGDLGGNLYALDAETSDQIWLVEMPEAGSVQAAPVVVNDIVYFVLGQIDPDNEDQDAGTIVALFIEDGSEVWRETTRMPVFTQPVVVGDALAVAPSAPEDPVIFLYNLETGSQQGTPLRPAGDNG